MDLALYFDHNATTPIRPEALEAMVAAARDFPGNPSSQHALGRRARTALEEARDRLAKLLGARATEVYFTSGGTESNRLALEGALQGAMDASVPTSSPAASPHAVVAATEHKSVLEVCEQWVSGNRAEITYIPADACGRVCARAMVDAVRSSTRLLAVQGSNNETGAVQPVSAIARLLRERFPAVATRPLLHVDLVQSFGKIAVEPAALGADLASFSAHKFGGPRGAGALWVRPGTSFRPSLRGGPQERKVRPGTEALPAIVGMVKAAEVALANLKNPSLPAESGTTRETPADYLARRVGEELSGVRRNGGPGDLLPNTANLALEGIDAELLLIRLDGDGVAAAMGSACASGSREPSHVLRAMGFDDARIRSSVRFSTGWTTRRDDIERLVEILVRIVDDLRSRSVPGSTPDCLSRPSMPRR